MTAGQQVAEWGFALLTAVATPVTAWVGWKVSTWLESKKFLNKTEANKLVGENLSAATVKAIQYAQNHLEVPIASVVDSVAAKNAIAKTAVEYLWPKFEETMDRLGWGPDDLESYVKARLPAPVSEEAKIASLRPGLT